MKIACETCGAKYTIADDKVRGRRVKIRCKGCGTPIVVDGQHDDGQNLAGAEADADASDAEAAVVWSVNLSDADSRTMSVEEIVQGYASGLVTADAFVWKDGMADWVAILESEIAPLLAVGGVENLSSMPAPEPDPSPGVAPMGAVAGAFPLAANSPRATMPLFTAPNQATAATRPAATRAQSQPDNLQDLFGGIDAAGAEEEVATSAPLIPQAGASAYGDGNMTGARNENSVLFSLDALKAGFSPSAPAAKPVAHAPKAPSGGGRPRQPSNPDDPFDMGASAGLMGVAGGGALFGGNNQALLMAPAPPPPPVAPSPVLMTAGTVPMGAARRDNKLVLIVGAISGVVILGLVLALVLGRNHDETPSAEGAASAASPASAGAAPSALADVKKDEPPTTKPEEKPAASASAAPADSASAMSSSNAREKPTAAVVASKAPTADATKKKEDPIPAGASDAPPFSKSSAISALTAASMSASTCKKPGGPTGSGKATVTFAPSGHVTTATVSGAFAGTPTGGCIASGFRKAHVPAFSGSAVTVSKNFTIN